MNTKMKLKNILTVSLAVFLSACNNSNNDNPVQSNSGYIDNDGSQYQNTPITNTPQLTNTEALAVGTVGVATGYAVGKYANKPRYSKPNTSYSKPAVVVNKHYYRTKQKVQLSRYKRK